MYATSVTEALILCSVIHNKTKLPILISLGVISRSIEKAKTNK